MPTTADVAQDVDKLLGAFGDRMSPHELEDLADSIERVTRESTSPRLKSSADAEAHARALSIELRRRALALRNA